MRRNLRTTPRGLTAPKISGSRRSCGGRDTPLRRGRTALRMIVIVLGLMASFLPWSNPSGLRSREARSHPWPPGRGRERPGPADRTRSGQVAPRGAAAQRRRAVGEGTPGAGARRHLPGHRPGAAEAAAVPGPRRRGDESDPDRGGGATHEDPGRLRQATVKAVGSRWSCTFVDDFDAVKFDRTKWVPATAIISGRTSGAFACYRDHKDNVSVEGGTLRLTVRKLDQPCAVATSGRAPRRTPQARCRRYRLFSQRFGRFEARFKVTATEQQGLQEAFWMWPDDRQDIKEPWPAAGEIDVVETYSDNHDLAIPFLHYTWNNNGGPRPGSTPPGTARPFGASSTPTRSSGARAHRDPRQRQVLPGQHVGRQGVPAQVHPGADPSARHRKNHYDGAAPLPATMTVDYVRVWR